MSMDLTGITNVNEYYTNHYLSSIFEENAAGRLSAWRAEAKESEEVRTPWSHLRDHARTYYAMYDRYLRAHFDMQTLANIQLLADEYLKSLGYPEAAPQRIMVDGELEIPVYLEQVKSNGAPELWVLLAASEDKDAGILEKKCFFSDTLTDNSTSAVFADQMTQMPNEDLITKILFGSAEPPRFLLLIGMNQIALIDRNKWNEKRYLQFELNDIFSRHEETTLQAMAVLLHRESLCPDDGKILLDELEENSQRHASGVSQDLKYALRESIELLGNEVLYDLVYRQGQNLEADPVDAGQLTLECLRYMYRMLFVLFIEARPELGYAPMKAQSYLTGYSLESLRDIADNVRDAVSEVGDGYYLHETLSKLYHMIYFGYPETDEALQAYAAKESLHNMFVVAPLKAHIFDPEYTPLLTQAKIRNRVMLRIVELMSLTRPDGRRNSRRGRISYANLGINQMGAVYEALLSYRGFIAEHDLYEVKRAGDSFSELDVGYFVPECDLEQYTEEERVRYEKDAVDGSYKKGQLRKYVKGTFIYRLAGREREKSASYYTPEVLTKCLVKYALKELLEGKSADDILQLTVCEPAMGSAAFLNEAINQLAEAYLDKKQKEIGTMIPAQRREQELQKVKMFIADRNVYGIDLNPVAVELAEVSLWLNTIYSGGFVPWFGTQLVNGNSLIGARRQVYRVSQLTVRSKGMRWYEHAPERVPVGQRRVEQRSNVSKRQVYHFLLGDPGMASYTDKVIKTLEPDAIKKLKSWNKEFNASYSEDEVRTLLYLSSMVDELWENQIKLRKTIGQETQDTLSVFGHEDTSVDSHTSIRQKDEIYSKLYKSEHMQNAGPYARLKFAMDYWCALWFWPIHQVDLLPSRSEFLNDMSLILEGTFTTRKDGNLLDFQQLSLFPTEQDALIEKINELFPGQSVVDLDNLCDLFPRLALVQKLAEQNHFMHWELEFADLFAERGGFDLVIGNPPWILLGWNEQDLLSDYNPIFSIRDYSASNIAELRSSVLQCDGVRAAYINEYETIAGMEQFLCGIQNYAELSGMKTNLYKCFLPQSWNFTSQSGVSAFVHPEGVFDDPKGGKLRRVLYPKLRCHFQFRNELKLFNEVHHSRVFGLNVYSNSYKEYFESINNLFDVSTIDECYEKLSDSCKGIKNEQGKWNTDGNTSRILRITTKELKVFARLFDSEKQWAQTKLLALHSKVLLSVVSKLAQQKNSMGSWDDLYVFEMWNETNAQRDRIITRKISFPDTLICLIMSGSHIGVCNPFFKTPRRVCNKNSDFDSIDLTYLQNDYLPRSNYGLGCSINEYIEKIPVMPSGIRYDLNYRIFARKMIDPEGARTLMASLAAPEMGHVSGISGILLNNNKKLLIALGCLSSLPIDYLLKATAKANFQASTIKTMPMIQSDSKFANSLIWRVMLLNCLTLSYKNIWEELYVSEYDVETFSKKDVRLDMSRHYGVKWRHSSPLRVDFERRIALVEIDVLVAMAFGLTLDELKNVYRLQFHILYNQEKDTWYDTNGRIVFTNNRSLTGVGFSRQEFENANAVTPI